MTKNRGETFVQRPSDSAQKLDQAAMGQEAFTENNFNWGVLMLETIRSLLKLLGKTHLLGFMTVTAWKNTETLITICRKYFCQAVHEGLIRH